MLNTAPTSGPSANSDGSAEDVALDVMLGLDNLALVDFDVPSSLSFPVFSWMGAPGARCSFRGKDAAVDFEIAEGKAHRRLAAKDRKMAGVNDSANGAVNAGPGGQNHLAAEINRLGHFGDKGIAALGDGGA